MKKRIIAGAGVAILTATSLPFTGVFAVEGGASRVDEITVNIEPSCQMVTDGDGKLVVLTAGQIGAEYEAQSGTTMSMSCNTQNGWTLKATVSDLVGIGHQSWTIPFGAYDAHVSEDKSVWSVGIKMADGALNTQVEAGWSDFSATAANDTVIVQGNGASMATVTPEYKAYVGEDALNGVYQGEILYTFMENEQ